MIDLFISYASEDKRLAKRLCDDLTARGLKVWWDAALLGGQQYRPLLLERLREAKAVVVIWTARSTASRWVSEEAEEAAELGKLVATREDDFDPRELPLGFMREALRLYPEGFDQGLPTKDLERRSARAGAPRQR